MVPSVRRFGVAALAGLAVCGALPSTAHAQARRPGTVVGIRPAPFNPLFMQNRFVPFIPNVGMQSINRNPYITPSLTLGQAAYNTAVLGQGYPPGAALTMRLLWPRTP